MGSKIECPFYGISIIPAELDFTIEEGSPYVPGVQIFHVKTTGTGGSSPRWSISVDTDWVSFNRSSGVGNADIVVHTYSIGKPLGEYLANITLNSTEAPNAPQYAGVKLTVMARPIPLRIITRSIPAGIVGGSYDAQLEAVGGIPPYKWSCIGLPPGLILNVPSGYMTGVPQLHGVSTVSVTVEDSVGNSRDTQYVLTISKRPEPVVVEVISPVGDEVWYAGDTHDIRWSSNNGEGKALDIYLYYYRDFHLLKSGIPIKSFSYSWQITGVIAEYVVVELRTDYGVADSNSFTIKEYPKRPICRFLAKIWNKL